ncbi:374_t:CDS:2 [Entrophospora sp. SA101]|nr:374_t:CDS:2 [Entrophospora sp. SA101]CAJ0834390.1 16004_t:CDS:2 [Entrophospora sp. SA101]
MLWLIDGSSGFSENDIIKKSYREIEWELYRRKKQFEDEDHKLMLKMQKSVQTTLEVLDKVGVKDNIEEAIRNIDKDTPEQREEEKRITRRIYRDLVVVLATSFIMYLLDHSFSPNGISEIFQPLSPAGLQGPIYYNGILKVFNVLRPKVESYDSSVKKLDAQFSQILGTISQILIIIAASLSASSNITSLNGTSDSGTVTSFPTRLGGFVQIENNQVEEQSIAVKHASDLLKPPYW